MLRAARAHPALTRGFTVTLGALVCLVAGSVLGWRLAGATTTETEIGRVAFEVRPSIGGEVSAFVPLADWGFRADAIDAPLEIGAELRTIDRSAITRAAEGDRTILIDTQDQIAGGAARALVRAAIWALVATCVLLSIATALWRGLRPRWLLLAVGAGIGVLSQAATLAAAHRSFDERSFEQPTYYARGAELERILDVATGQPLASEYGQTLASVLRSVTLVLDQPQAPSAPGRDLFVASDFHANGLVVDPLSGFINDTPLLLAGDYGQRGGELEARAIAPQVASLGSRAVAVSGNHDTSRLMGSLRSHGVVVLGDEPAHSPEVTTLDGLRVAGFPDPLEWREDGDPASRPVTFAELPDPEAGLEAATMEMIAGFDSLSPSPDVVIVHQNALAQALARTLHERGYRRPLTVVTGHDHRQHVDVHGAIVVVDGGSVGAGGVFDAGREPIGFARLQLAPANPSLRSVDLIAIEPLSGRARAAHVTIDSLCEDEEPVCSFAPSSPVDETP